MKSLLLLTIVPALFGAGCATNKSEKAMLHRGWIGGEYRQTKHALASGEQRRVVYVKQVYAGTPAEQAGFKTADVIVAVNGQAVTRLPEFRQCVDAAPPRSRVVFRVWRAGETLELPVTIGRESYQRWHSVRFGLGFSSKVDLWPDRNFSLCGLLDYNLPSDRLELRSPETLLSKPPGQTPAQGDAGTRSDEGWSIWFVLFGLDAHKRIVSQDSVPSPTAQR